MGSGEIPDWLGCPLCHGRLDHAERDRLICSADDLIFPIDDGIICLLPPEAQSSAEVFATDYDERRRAQGWRRLDAVEIAALPAQTLDGWEPLYWGVRRQSFQRLEKLIDLQRKQADRRLRIVDMGTGVGWLAHHLAGEGHEVIALDISDSDAFGLGAARRLRAHSGMSLALVQGMLENPPLRRGQVDTLIFNASLHYVTRVPDYLRRCLDLLSPAGQMVILDSPVVRHAHPLSPNWSGGRHLTYSDLRIDVEAQMTINRIWRGPGWWWRVLRGAVRGDAFHLPVITIRRGTS